MNGHNDRSCANLGWQVCLLHEIWPVSNCYPMLCIWYLRHILRPPHHWLLRFFLSMTSTFITSSGQSSWCSTSNHKKKQLKIWLVLFILPHALQNGQFSLLKLGSHYDASQRVIHLKPVQNRSKLTLDDAHPFAPQRLNRNLFYSCVRVAMHHSVNPP